MQNAPIDEIDKKILEILQKDGRISYSKIARMLGLSEATIHLRVKKLKEKGVLKGFIALVDPEKVGKDVAAIILAKIDADKYRETVEKIAQFEDVYEVYDVTGDYSTVLKVRVSSKEELAELLDKLGEIEGVRETYTMYILRTIKEEKTVRLD